MCLNSSTLSCCLSSSLGLFLTVFRALWMSSWYLNACHPNSPPSTKIPMSEFLLFLFFPLLHTNSFDSFLVLCQSYSWNHTLHHVIWFSFLSSHTLLLYSCFLVILFFACPSLFLLAFHLHLFPLSFSRFSTYAPLCFSTYIYLFSYHSNSLSPCLSTSLLNFISTFLDIFLPLLSPPLYLHFTTFLP